MAKGIWKQDSRKSLIQTDRSCHQRPKRHVIEAQKLSISVKDSAYLA